MAREIGKLTALKVARISDPGMYGDGANLWLQVSRAGTKSWTFRFMQNGRAREMGLGPLHTVSLADAREKALRCRRQCLDGIDPIEARQKARAQARLEHARAITFKDAALRYIETHKAGWRNAKHAAQWQATLETYAFPIFGSLPVQAIDVALVMKVLEPIWATKTETASRLRGRIEAILDWATTREYRAGENPARWKGHLENLLPRRAKVQRVAHHAALPYGEIKAFMKALSAEEGVSALALQFLILTAARTAEVIGARWSELDLKAGVWAVPAERMKGGRDHRVPLSPGAKAILVSARNLGLSAGSDSFVFPGGRKGKGLSNMALITLLRRMGRDDLTAHGFRSTFRDWAAETTHFPREVAEQALAHVLENKVEAAYRRGDLFDKRRKLMATWAGYCGA